MKLYFCVFNMLNHARMIRRVPTHFMLIYILLQGVLKVYLQRFLDETKIHD